MAIITALKTGVWSDSTVWPGGTFPQAGDTVRPATFTVTIDQDVTVTTLEITSSGVFQVTNTLSGTRTINANLLLSNGGGNGINLAHNGANIVNFNGTISATGGSGTGINITGTGVTNITANGITAAAGASIIISGLSTVTINCTGNISGISSSFGAVVAISANATVTITVTSGNIIGGTAATSYGVNVSAAAATVIINGNAVGGSSSNSVGVQNGTSSVTINGNVTGSSISGGSGAVNSGTGVMTITGTAEGGATAHGAQNTGAGTLIVGTALGNHYGPGGDHGTQTYGVLANNTVGQVTKVYKIQYGPYGQSPTNGAVKLMPDVTNQATFIRSDNGQAKTLVDNSAACDLPVVGNVRSGTHYGNNNYTGTLAVPAANHVSLGTAVDNTTGTAVLLQADVQAALTAQGLTTTRAGYLDRLIGVLDANLVQILGTALTETAGQIASGFKKFFNISTPASTMDRIVLVDTTTTLTNAPDVSGALAAYGAAKTGDEMNLTSAYDAAKIAASQASVNAIPTNPLLTTDPRLDHLDADITSRLEGSAYTIPDNAGISAIKASTDNLPIDPASQSALLTAISALGLIVSSLDARVPANPVAIGDEVTLSDQAITDAKIAASALEAIADMLLVRDVDQVEGVAPVHSMTTAILKAVSLAKIESGVLKTYRTDGTTLHMSQPVVTHPNNEPIDSVGVGS